MTPPQPHEEHPVAALLAPDILVLLDEAPETIAGETEEVHPADLADVVELLPPNRVADFFRALTSERAASILEYLDEEPRTALLEAMTSAQAAQLVSEMSPDDRADVLDELEETVADDILDEMPADEREATEQLRAYDPDSAGGLMTTEFISVSELMTSEAALAVVRAAARSQRREAIYAIYVTDADQRLQGVLSLRELLAAPEGARMGDVAWSEVQRIAATADREEVSQIIQKYSLVAVPVVDQFEHIVGVVTVDDAIEVLQEEQTEDVQKLGGMEAIDDAYLATGFWTMIRKRLGWLTVLFIGESFTAVVMQQFEVELAQAVVLMLFVPLIVSSGGNSGSQATSLIIRAMALREIGLRDWWRVAMRELPSGLMLGAVLGLIGVLRVVGWQQLGFYDYGPHYVLVALTVGIAVLGVVTFGSLAGSMLPFVLRRAGFDPASASAPFVATLVDVSGLAIYFAVAALLLRGTLL